MPIVEIEVVVNDGDALRASLAQEIADVLGRIFETPQGKTWVRVRTLDRSSYGENGGVPEYARPVFVRVLKAQRPETAALQREIRLVTHAVAAALDRPGQAVHVLYESDARGRLAFGGELVQ